MTAAKNATPTLSIIFPAHNEEARLRAALISADSFITTRDFTVEVLVVENASMDNTLQIASEFASSHPYVRVLHSDTPGKGLAVQRVLAFVTVEKNQKFVA